MDNDQCGGVGEEDWGLGSVWGLKMDLDWSGGGAGYIIIGVRVERVN